MNVSLFLDAVYSAKLQKNKFYVFFYVFFCVCWLSAHFLQDVLCMWVLWASQLSCSCVGWPLCLIIYSLCCHTAGWMCSLQRVFHFSSHLAHLNKIVSILKALSFYPCRVMAAAGRCKPSLNRAPPSFQYSVPPSSREASWQYIHKRAEQIMDYEGISWL